MVIIGTLQKATTAKTETEKGQEKEIIALAYNSALAKKVSNGDSTAVTAGDLNPELTTQEAIADGSNPIKVTFTTSKRQYTINSNGTIEYAGIKNDEEDNDLEIGDIITNYISNTSLPTGINWIYFGTDTQGNKLLTTSKPIKNGFSYEFTAQGWLYYCMQEGDEDYREHSSELNANNNIHLACEKI